MKLWDIVKNVGSGIVRNAVPGADAILSTVNALLPGDKKLSENATGDDIHAAIMALPPEQQGEVLQKEFDVEITRIQESHATARAMLEAEANSKHTTRPMIAMGAFCVVAIISILIVGAWVKAVLWSDEAVVKEIVAGWPWVLAVLSPFIGWLNHYFGILKTEHKNRLEACGNKTSPDGIAGIISLFKRK